MNVSKVFLVGFILAFSILGIATFASAYTAPVGSVPSYYMNLYPQYIQTSAVVQPLFNNPYYAAPIYQYPTYPTYPSYPTFSNTGFNGVATGISIHQDNDRDNRVVEHFTFKKSSFKKILKKPFSKDKKHPTKFEEQVEDFFD